MNPSSLETIASRLATALVTLQDVARQPILRTLVETGQPIAPAHLAAHLSSIPDIEFDTQGQIVGWGITLVPTQHHFLLAEHALFTWCAFDTVLFPALLQVQARVQSQCSATGHPIRFVVTPEGVIKEVFPREACLSLMVLEEQSEHDDLPPPLSCLHEQ